MSAQKPRLRDTGGLGATKEAIAEARAVVRKLCVGAAATARAFSTIFLRLEEAGGAARWAAANIRVLDLPQLLLAARRRGSLRGWDAGAGLFSAPGALGCLSRPRSALREEHGKRPVDF